MSDNMKGINDYYEFVSNLKQKNFSEKSILIIGGGNMAKQFALALNELKIKNVEIISNSEAKVKKIYNEFGFKYHLGGFEKCLPYISKKDLCIIAVPIHLLIKAALMAIECGQKNILIEKPGSLYKSELEKLSKQKDVKIRVGYQRVLYPNLLKLKNLIKEEDGATSCKFCFTELVDKINFSAHSNDVFRYWGISNSLHPISMAMELIGFPKQISSYRSGKLDWHESGAVFVGSGISEFDIPFSYHADWLSNGRWGVEIMTKKNAYRILPLEELYACPISSFEWKKIDFDVSFTDVKPGIAEEIAIMLYNEKNLNDGMITVEKAIKFNEIAEEIFGYNIKTN